MNIKFGDGRLGGFFVSFDSQIVKHTRSIYSALDFLGDVGGLYDMLKLVAEVLLSVWSLIAGCGVDAYLLQSIFKESTNLSEDTTSEIKSRKPFSVGWSLCCLMRRSKRRRMLDRGF